MNADLIGTWEPGSVPWLEARRAGVTATEIAVEGAPMKMTEADRKRFISKVERSGDCWLWTGAQNGKGYGRFYFQGRLWLAHRFAYEWLVGQVPAGLVLDHTKDQCSSRSCVNPSHLEPVTNRENLLRGDGWAGRHARKTHCPKGHPYDETNTWIWRGGRHCRACKRASSARQYERKKMGGSAA